jgi:thiol-disulfide isomerase/thioredoxin
MEILMGMMDFIIFPGFLMEYLWFLIKPRMRTANAILLLLGMSGTSLLAQDATLNIGDPAPPIQVKEWLKGEPFQTFEKGQVYVVEFWATWCAPCRAAMPHLSELAEKYKGKVTILGVDQFNKEIVPLKKVKSFVDSMGSRMNYRVATEDSNFMQTGWITAVGDTNVGIPNSFVVNEEGRLAWIGHPKDLAKVLHKIVRGNWDLQEAMAQRNMNRYIDSIDMEAHYRLMPYLGKSYAPDDMGKPELVLMAINSMVINEPKLKYAHRIAYQTFASLLKTDMKKALVYGKESIKQPGYRYPGSYSIFLAIDWYSDKLKLSPEIYCLGAEAYRDFIDRIPYPEPGELHYMYSKMADWYSRANKRSKAVKSIKKAIEDLKSMKDFSQEDLAAYESRLQLYKNK